MKRGSVSRKESTIIALWLPKPLLESLDRAVRAQDSDRSKLIRKAIREKIGMP